MHRNKRDGLVIIGSKVTKNKPLAKKQAAIFIYMGRRANSILKKESQAKGSLFSKTNNLIIIE
jgi:hypothetical protein